MKYYVCIHQPFCVGRMWHKVNFLTVFKRFVPQKGYRTQSTLLFTHNLDSYLSEEYACYVKCKQSRRGFELVLPCLYPTTLTRALLSTVCTLYESLCLFVFFVFSLLVLFVLFCFVLFFCFSFWFFLQSSRTFLPIFPTVITCQNFL